MSKQHIGVMVGVAIVFAAGGFFGGVKYQESKTKNVQTQGFQNLNGQQRQQLFLQNGGANRRAGGGFTVGQIISKDDKSITVKLQNGGSAVVYYSAGTAVEKPAAVDASQLAVGDNVTVMGTVDAQSGIITAQSIQIRPAPPAGATNQQPQGTSASQGQ